MMTMQEMIDFIHEHKLNIYSLTMIENGEESSRVINGANACNDIYSVSKNFTATAIGILCDRGKLSLTDTVWDIFHDEYPKHCTELWKSVTVEHVLTQTIGISAGFLDIDVEDVRTYTSRDYMEMVLSAPLPYAPGEKMVYSDSNYYFASRIAAKAAGERLQDFLQRELFEPLEFQGQAWACCPLGHAMGATGLFIRVCDMAKFGQLYLQNGEWKGQQILSQRWVREATVPRFTENYGYSFWMQGEGRYACGGMYGQNILIFPRSNAVVAWQAYDPEGKVGSLVGEILRRESDDRKA